jgi:formate hydrogenlyase transcriptional activator
MAGDESKSYDHVGPVLQAGTVSDAIISAIRDLNKDVLVVDRGAYLRVLAPERCVVTRGSIEEHLGRSIRFPGELEAVMSSFKGAISLSQDEAVWQFKAQDQKLKPFEGRLQTIIDTVPVMAWSARADGSIDFFNEQWHKYTGLTPEQSLNWGWKVAKHPEDLPRIQKALEKAAATGQPFEVEGRIRRQDGIFRWFLIRCNPQRDQSGAVVRWYGTDIDIEERKRAEDAVRANEQNLRLIIDSIPGSVFTANAAGELEVINHQALHYTGAAPEDIKNWQEGGTLHPEDRPRVVEAWNRAMKTGEPVDVEARNRGSDGTYGWVHMRNRPQRDADGRIVRWYNLMTDIDKRKRAESELAGAFEEIKRLKDRLQDENVALREQIDQTFMFEEIVGASPALRAAVSAVCHVAPTDSTVLLLGETGTGKELFARVIHKNSGRSQRSFVSISCAAIPQALIASELFGHEKGAFTGAQQRRLGRFELANGGTLFLDEIGELPPDTQVALLRVLQEREFERVGGTQPIKADVRVIAATNRDLSAAVTAGAFRSDLFYRLNVFPIEIPPLRRREEDIPLLIEYFVYRYARNAGKKISGIDKKSLNLLRNYAWPGNIRELQNIIERAIILCESTTVAIDESWLSKAPAAKGLAKQSNLFKSISPEDEKAIIEAALRDSEGRVYGPSGAAEKLGIPRSTLESKIRNLKINKHRFRDSASVVETE